MILHIILLFILILIISIPLYLTFAPQLGGRLEGQRLERVERSENYRDGIFRNKVETYLGRPDSSFAQPMKEYYSGKEQRTPSYPLPSMKPNFEKFMGLPEDELQIIWFGHSSVLIKMDGRLLLVDPVFNKQPSPLPFLGPKAFPGTHIIEATAIPDIDIIVITHDHYDHLDRGTILELEPRTGQFLVPLGVGAHLERWGIHTKKIVELDWWEEHDFPSIHFIATPTRHFSGRSPTYTNKTLWTSWVAKGKNHSVFMGGDSGYHAGFREIGEKYGPFDLTMLECGQYSKYWPDIHMMPEQTFQAHLDLRGEILLPIHWGKYSISLHNWDEPIQRLLGRKLELEHDREANENEALGTFENNRVPGVEDAHGEDCRNGEKGENIVRNSREASVQVATPVIGQTMILGEDFPENHWWEK